MQAYIKALTKAGTPVNVNIVLAAAEGVVPAVDRTLIFSFSQMSSEPQKLYSANIKWYSQLSIIRGVARHHTAGSMALLHYF